MYLHEYREKNRRFYTRLLSSGCDGRASGHSHGDRVEGEEKARDDGSDALSHSFISHEDRAHDQRVRVLPCAEQYSSQNAVTSLNPPQQLTLSTRRGGSKMFNKQPQGHLTPVTLGAIWLSGQRGAGRTKNTLCPQTEPRTDCPASGAGSGAAVTHTESPCSMGRSFPLVTFFYTFIFYVLLLHCSFLLL